MRSDSEPADGAILAGRGEHAAPQAGDGRGLARAGLIELGYAPGEADGLLLDAQGDSAEELIAHALRLARAGS